MKTKFTTFLLIILLALSACDGFEPTSNEEPGLSKPDTISEIISPSGVFCVWAETDGIRERGAGLSCNWDQFNSEES